MGFDYKWTCPEINQNIKDAEATIKCKIDDIMEQLCPLWKGGDRDKQLDEWSGELYKELEGLFEDVRSTNENMRSAAEKQIDALESEIERLKLEIKEKESDIKDKDAEIYALEEKINTLE